MNRNSNMKAQFWSFDVIFAIIIFSIAITLLGFAWYNVSNQLSLSYGGGTIVAQLQTKALAQNLLSPGSPANWPSLINTTNTVTWGNVSIGLASTSGIANLSSNKLYTFIAMSNTNYQATKQELGIGYDYYIEIYGGPINVTVGKNPSTNGALSIYVEKRNAFLQGNPVTITTIVWTNTALAVS